jgi:hypothetical protein
MKLTTPCTERSRRIYVPDSVADELAIRGLTAHFNHMADQLRGADCAAAFTENGVLEAAGRLEGRAAIAAFFDAQAHGEPVDIGFGKTGHLFSTVHATTDNVITIEGDKATQMSYMLVFRRSRVNWHGMGSMSSLTAGMIDLSGRTPVGCSSTGS